MDSSAILPMCVILELLVEVSVLLVIAVVAVDVEGSVNFPAAKKPFVTAVLLSCLFFSVAMAMLAVSAVVTNACFVILNFLVDNAAKVVAEVEHARQLSLAESLCARHQVHGWQIAFFIMVPAPQPSVKQLIPQN